MRASRLPLFRAPRSRGPGFRAVLGVAVLALLTSTTPSAGAAEPRPDAARAGSAAAEGPASPRHHGHDRGRLPSTFDWKSSGVLVSPKPDASHDIVSIKDPTVVRYRDRWHVYATTANTAGNWSLAYTSFENWSRAPAAPQKFLDTNPGIGTGYRAAPQLFYFAPQRKWYLVYQTGLPSFSTTRDISRPETWTPTRNMMESEPPIVTEGKGTTGFWLDYWVICDAVNCHLFSSDDEGQLYRASTKVRDFPYGWGETVIAMQDPDRFDLFEGASVYKLRGTKGYLLLVEAIGATGRRYYRSWTSGRIEGPWRPLAGSESEPFAGAANVTFRSGTPAWTQDFSHGELLRAGIDQRLELDPCRLRFLYQGEDPAASGEYSQLPWRLGVLTQTNSRC